MARVVGGLLGCLAGLLVGRLAEWFVGLVACGCSKTLLGAMVDGCVFVCRLSGWL